MKKRQKTESESRVKTLILIIVFIAIMFILSTYAWFSTQRNVTISNLEGIVNVAEGLEISLDASTWSNSLNLSELKIAGETNNAYPNNTNINPVELFPASTLGTAGNNAQKTLTMYRGTNSGIQLRDIVLCSESETSAVATNYPAYFAFDIFLKDSSRTNADNNLLLTTNSTVTVRTSGDPDGVPDYGLQNTVRVALAKYSETAEYNDGQTEIINKTVNATASTIKQVTIWEPNSNFHVDTIVTSNNKLKVPSAMSSQIPSGKFGRDTKLDTYALVDNATKLNTQSGGGEPLYAGSDNQTVYGISDVYDWTKTTNVALQKTVKTTINVPTSGLPENYEMTGEDSLKGVTLTDTSANGENFQIAANAVTRVRVYVWLEGQDVDCVNYASHGGGIKVDFGLQK